MYSLSDPVCSDQMFSRNYCHRLLGLSRPRPSLVQVVVVVYVTHFQLLLLWRESGRLLRSFAPQNGNIRPYLEYCISWYVGVESATLSDLPSVHIVLPLRRRLRLVRPQSGQEVLYEAVLSGELCLYSDHHLIEPIRVLTVRMDSCYTSDSGDAVVSDSSEHVWGSHLVHCTRFDDCLQWHNGVFVWLLLW